MKNVLAKLGCKVYGHHPWVGNGVSFGDPDEEDGNGVLVTLRTDYGSCKRCGSHDSVKHDLSIRKYIVRMTPESFHCEVFAHNDNGSIEVVP